MRILLAFRVFFAILFGIPLPWELMELPYREPPEGTKRPGALDIAAAKAALESGEPAKAEPVAPVPVPVPVAPPQPRAEPVPEPVAVAPAKPAVDEAKTSEAAAVQVLAVLQSEGRLLDFLSEDIEGYADADIGAAVRDVHRGLRRALKDHFPVEPIRSEEEGAALMVPDGFDPSQIRLVGNVVGKPPFSGRLKHRGWKVGQVRLPRLPSGEAAHVAAPAEVEL